jgi:hypothetical protein
MTPSPMASMIASVAPIAATALQTIPMMGGAPPGMNVMQTPSSIPYMDIGATLNKTPLSASFPSISSYGIH